MKIDWKRRLICWLTWHHPWIADGWEHWQPIYCARCGTKLKEESPSGERSPPNERS